MGQIERALDRARTQPQRGAGTRDILSRAVRPRIDGTLGAQMDFKALRRVELDPAWLQRKHVIATSERSSASESFKMLRTRVRRTMESGGLTTLAISSPTASEGKTLVAVNLALRIAADPGAQVILADFDLRHPSVSETLGLDPNLPGLAQYLSGEANLEEVCVCPGPEGLAILPNSIVFENSSEVLSSEVMTELVGELRGHGAGRGPTVIFDLPPLLSADDLLAFSAHIDAMLLVVNEGKTLRSDLSDAVDSLAGINVIGTVLNNSVGRSETYY